MISLSATRAHALEQLAAFMADAGRSYADRRDADHGPDARAMEASLNAYLRHRFVASDEVVQSVGAQSSGNAAAALIEDLYQRGYAAGWLERHPAVFRRYFSDVLSIEEDLDNHSGLKRAHQMAINGETAIACFNAWANEVVAGSLHDRSQRAFASIWVFTLKLPWQLGARFFMRHLLDAEMAAVLLLWREVAGLEAAKAEIVTPEDIENLTVRRFPRAAGLATSVADLEPELPYLSQAIVSRPAKVAAGPAVLLVTSDDLHPESWQVDTDDVKGVVLIEPFDLYGWHSERMLSFKLAGLDDAARRAAAHFNCPTVRLKRDAVRPAMSLKRSEDRNLRDWLEAVGRVKLVAMAPSVGPTQDDIAAACEQLAHADRPPQLELLRRPWDNALMPVGKDGAAAFSLRMPDVLAELGLDHNHW